LPGDAATAARRRCSALVPHEHEASLSGNIYRLSPGTGGCWPARSLNSCVHAWRTARCPGGRSQRCRRRRATVRQQDGAHPFHLHKDTDRSPVHSSRLTPTPARPARTPGIQGAPSGDTAAFPLLRRGLARSPARTSPAQTNSARRPNRSSAPCMAPARSRGGLARRPGVAAARRPSSVHHPTSSSTRRPSHGDGDAQGHGRPKNAIRRGTAMLRREGRHPDSGFTATRLHTRTDTARTQGEEEEWMAVVLTVGRRCRRGRPDEDGS
jgi:hypothetical protein